MTVIDLNREQLDELKQAYATQLAETDQEVIGYEGLTSATEIPDEVIFRHYEGIIFSEDDFFVIVESEDNMDTNKIIEIIRKEYAEVVIALKEAETEYNANKRKVKKRETFQFVAAQEMELSELCGKLGIELWNDDMELIGG